MNNIYATKQYAEEILEEWYNSGSMTNLIVKKMSKNLYLIVEEQ